VKGSNAAFEMLVSGMMTQLKKVEDDSFLPVDIRPNGRPLFGYGGTSRARRSGTRFYSVLNCGRVASKGNPVSCDNR
jgi:hypothetical protein